MLRGREAEKERKRERERGRRDRSLTQLTSPQCTTGCCTPCSYTTSKWCCREGVSAAVARITPAVRDEKAHWADHRCCDSGNTPTSYSSATFAAMSEPAQGCSWHSRRGERAARALHTQVCTLCCARARFEVLPSESAPPARGRAPRSAGGSGARVPGQAGLLCKGECL